MMIFYNYTSYFAISDANIRIDTNNTNKLGAISLSKIRIISMH